MVYTKDQLKSHIAEVQKFLRTIAEVNKKIPTVIPDGIYDERTKNAVSAFQREYGLPVTGEVDLLTWNSLVREYNSALPFVSKPREIRPYYKNDTAISVGDRGHLVYIIQIMLDTLAEEWDNLSPLLIDGVFGKETAEAVRGFQRLAGLKETEIVDIETWNFLARTYNSVNSKI